MAGLAKDRARQTATKIKVAKSEMSFLGILEISTGLSSVCNSRLGCIRNGLELDFQAKESGVSKRPRVQRMCRIPATR
jgi:hypothetical protein